MGANKYNEIASMLDEASLNMYNDYVLTYLVGDDKSFSDNNDKLEKVAWMDSVKEGTEWVSKKLESAFNQYKNALTWVWGEANEIQKSLQRKFWQIGTQVYLGEGRGYLTSAWMLEHSLQDNPSDIWRGNDSRIAYLMNHDSAYLKGIDEKIAKAANEKRDWIDNEEISVRFKTGDLYFSIHKMDISLNGYKREDGKWIINAHGEDWYDFTEITSFMGDEKYK